MRAKLRIALTVSSVFPAALIGTLWAADAAKGQKLFKAKCASCHGTDGSGNPAMEKNMKLPADTLNLRDEDTLKKSDEGLAATTNNGKGSMPSYKGKLKAEEMKDIFSYLRASGGTDSITPAQALGAASNGATLYQKNCASCHGKDGKGNPALGKAFKVGAGALDLTDEETLAKSEADLGNVIGSGKGRMPGYKGKLSDSEVAMLLAYIRSVAPKQK